jgi:hypothetical protein
MICDEVWAYENGIATLVGLQIICPDCSGVIHIGEAIQAGYGPVATDHLMRVNAIERTEALRLVDDAFAVWRDESRMTWKTTVARDLLARYPALAVLSDRVASPDDGTGGLDDGGPRSR